MGSFESNSKPSGRSEKFGPLGLRPQGRNFFDLPSGLEFDSTLPNPYRIYNSALSLKDEACLFESYRIKVITVKHEINSCFVIDSSKIESQNSGTNKGISL